MDRGKITIFSATKKASPQDTTQATSRRCDQTPDVIVTTGRISPPRTAEFPPTWGMQAWHRKSANSPTSKTAEQFADPGNQLRGTVRLLVSSSQLRTEFLEAILSLFRLYIHINYIHIILFVLYCIVFYCIVLYCII